MECARVCVRISREICVCVIAVVKKKKNKLYLTEIWH